jgi:hypothetical protein
VLSKSGSEFYLRNVLSYASTVSRIEASLLSYFGMTLD